MSLADGRESRIPHQVHEYDVLDEHVSGRQNHEKLLWTLLNLELWHRAYA